MILMPELCYYCREELNFGDMTLHDGHRVHKKCLPPTNDTNKWDESARKAADDIVYEHGKTLFPTAQADEIEYHILNAFADLRATYEKLAELAITYRRWLQIKVMFDEGEVEPAQMHKLSAEMDQCRVELANLYQHPLVQSAIERSKNSAKP